MNIRFEKTNAPASAFAFRTAAAGLIFYGLVVITIAVAQRDQINPDGVAYLRNAHYLAEGHWFDSISGYWSPLISWCIAPWLRLGLDGLVAAHLTTCLWGAVLVLGVAVFLSRCTSLPFWWQWLAILPVGLATARWATCMISPDIPLAALILWYFCITASPRLLGGRKMPFLAGVFGGLAFWAKSYAFPFFAVHFTLSVALAYFNERNASGKSEKRSGKKAVGAWLCGMAAFAVVAGSWVGVLSWKYGRFTISTAAAFNHYVVGPPDETHPVAPTADFGRNPKFDVLYRLQKVPPGRMTVWETPDQLHFTDWSPLASGKMLKYQVKYVAKNGLKIIRTLGQFDVFAIVPGLLLLAPLIRLAARRRGMAGSYPVAWSLMTVGVYAGGYLPLAFETRYISPELMPLCCVLAMGVFFELDTLIQTAGTAKRGGNWAFAAAMFCALSFAAAAAAHIAADMVSETSGRHPSAYRLCGEKMQAAHCSGPIAANPGFWDSGLYVAYHASLPFAGEIETHRGQSSGANVKEIEKTLSAHGVGVFVASPSWDFYNDFSRQTHWRLIFKSGDGPTPPFCVWAKP